MAASERSTQKASRSTTRLPVSTGSVKQSSSQIVDIARSLLGIAYVYGGDDPSGFDCSGFTQYVYRKAGISIPRTAPQQQRAGHPRQQPEAR